MSKRHSEQSELPSGYTRLQYIESTGTQYIDTGVILGVEFSIQGRFFQNQIPESGYYYVFGVEKSSYPFSAILIRTDSVNSYLKIGILGNGVYDQFDSSAEYCFEMSMANGIKCFTFNGTKISLEDTVYQSPCNYSVYLFCANIAGTASRFGKAKIYNLIFKNNESVVRNLIPALRNSDSKPGLYDTINDVFYTNQGTGEFLYE